MKTLRSAVLAISCVAASVAFGQARLSSDELVMPVGLSANIGGGAIGFVNPDARAVGDVGGMWTARLTIGTRSLLAGELAYIGTAQGLSTLGLADQAMLLSNGAEGALRLNFTTGAWQPYAIAGLAWRHYDVTNSSFNTSSVRDSDDVGEVPLGIGLSYNIDRFIVDARVTYRQVFQSALIPDTNLSTLGAAAKVGFEF